MNFVRIVSRQHARYHALLTQTQLPDLTITEDPDQANIILADPPILAETIAHYSKLDWVQSTFAGIDALTKPTSRQDYQLTNIRGCFGQLIAEYVLGQLLMRSRHLMQYLQQSQQGEWQPHSYQSIAGRTLCILGTGSIGEQLAHAASALGLTVIGVNRSGNSPQGFAATYPIVQLTDALAQADIVVSTLPATPDTDDLLNATSLSHCRNALLFNVGRGNAVCEQGLLDAIDKGHIAHAWLDVFKQEPLPGSHAFWRHPSITVTPHIAAESFPEQVFAIFKRNYLAYYQGRELDYLVDFSRGY